MLIGELLLFLLWLASFFVFALSHRVSRAVACYVSGGCFWEALRDALVPCLLSSLLLRRLLLLQVEDASMSLSQLLSTGRCRLAVTAELTGQAAMLPFLWTEACTAAAYKLSWLLDARRLLGLSTYALQVGPFPACLSRLPCLRCWQPAARISAQTRLLPPHTYVVPLRL